MASLSVKLPLKYSSIDGFVMNKSIQRMLQQNLKMLLLTNPGERVMAPTFGVGLKMYLFSNQYEGIRDAIDDFLVFRASEDLFARDCYKSSRLLGN